MNSPNPNASPATATIAPRQADKAPTTEFVPPSTRQILLADLALLSVAVIWGVNIPMMKVALEMKSGGVSIHPYALNAIRLAISAFVLAGFAWHEYRGGVRPSANVSWLRVFIYAAVVSGAYQLLFLLAVSRATSADISLIMATVPMWTALTARYFLKENLPKLAWIGLIIAFAGTMIVTLQRDSPLVVNTSADNAIAEDSALIAPGGELPEQPIVDSDSTATQMASEEAAFNRFLGNILALAAALAWAGGTVFSRPLLKTISPIQLSACSATIGLPFHIAIAWHVLPASLPMIQEVPMQLCLLYSGVLSTGLALAMWSYGVKLAGAAQAAMFQNLTPIIAIAAAWLWRGESVSTEQTIGGIMIIGGLIIMRRSRQPLPATPQLAAEGK